eukprot:TRINITY_DN9014_c0_g1_i1.p1 TRINITY_DN9014_c0_g1~~TRINITY_DN9014_c0_g1_i1.p1  ORF type:complete len:281 (+),score=55.41 TRINITY_DN9014_c0_g1_i1:1410-2252(+)
MPRPMAGFECQHRVVCAGHSDSSQMAARCALEMACRDACRETREILSNGSGNKQGHVQSVPMSEEVGKLRSWRNVGTTPLGVELCWAKIAERAKCGNCAEMSAVALALLFRRGVHPVEKWSFPSGLGDHCFLLVGANPDTFIVDPWFDRVVPLCEYGAWKHAVWGAEGEAPPDDKHRVRIVHQIVHQVEKWSFPSGLGDHCFLLVGANPDTFIVDPWFDCVVPLCEYGAWKHAVWGAEGEAPPDDKHRVRIVRVDRPGSLVELVALTAEQDVPHWSMDLD